MVNKSGELAAKALILANETLLKENDILKSERDGFKRAFERTTNDFLAERKRANAAEIRVSNAINVIGGLALDMYEDALKKKDGKLATPRE
jgi:hypothetical protein